jgi:pimeloyl-ACP methyl ester carboxylesterase
MSSWPFLRRGTLLCALIAAAPGVVSCTDLNLLEYRDDALLARHRYALGEKYIDVGNLTLCYQERGQGDPVLILPGLGTDIDFWQLNVPALAERYHVLAVDLPGLGKSDKPDASYELPWICDRIVAFLDAKDLQRVSIVGGSLGGHLALLLALNHPDRVDKLVLMGSVGAWLEPDFLLSMLLRVLWNEWLVADYARANWPEIYGKMLMRETELTRELFRYQMAVRAAPHRYMPEGRALARALRSIFYHSCRQRLSEVQMPVLLVWGESDEIHPVEEGLFMRQHLPDARLVVIPDAAHEAMIDQPELFNRVVLEFLEYGTDGVQDSIVPR